MSKQCHTHRIIVSAISCDESANLGTFFCGDLGEGQVHGDVNVTHNIRSEIKDTVAVTFDNIFSIFRGTLRKCSLGMKMTALTP